MPDPGRTSSTLEMFNSDRVGINLEVVGHQKLTRVGEQPTWDSVLLVSNTSHSYTIQSITALDGIVFDPLYVRLKEASGRLNE